MWEIFQYTQKFKFGLQKVENLLGKGENAGNQDYFLWKHLSLIHQNEI